MSRRILVAALVIAVIVILGVSAMRHHRETPATGLSNQEVPSYWYDPMHPSQHFDKPGKSPFMDMQLVPKYAGRAMSDGKGTPVNIEIDPRVVQTLGIRLASVERGGFTRVVAAVGVVTVDEHRIEAIQVREPGWVERLAVRAVGDAVRRGQLLAGVYSPDLLATQQEFLIARTSKDPSLIEAARRRLGLFGLSDAQISRIDKTDQVERRIDYYAPFDGYVMELGARQGGAVEPGTTLFQLADLTSVWVIAEVPEAQAAWIKAGNPAEVQVPALPGERFQGKVDYLYPELTQATRTLKVRVVINNPVGHLRPGMFATAQLEGVAQQAVLTVPTEAVIQTGTRSIVILADDSSHFRPAVVRVGAEHGGRSEILDGLTPGQTVVASGQFLIDSEANLRSAFDALAGSGESTTDAEKPLLPQAPSSEPADEVH